MDIKKCKVCECVKYGKILVCVFEMDIKQQRHGRKSKACGVREIQLRVRTFTAQGRKRKQSGHWNFCKNNAQSLPMIMKVYNFICAV